MTGRTQQAARPFRYDELIRSIEQRGRVLHRLGGQLGRSSGLAGTRTDLARHLLNDGVATKADTVHLNIYPNRGTPIVGEVAGTRYAPPLAIIYDPADVATVLATEDAQLWLADRRTPTIGIGMVAGGMAVTIIAIGLLIRDARRRGVSWWQWYVDAARNPGHRP